MSNEEENKDVVFDDVETSEEQVVQEEQVNDLVSVNDADYEFSDEEVMDNLRQLDSLANMSPEIKEMPEYKAMKERVDEINAKSSDKEEVVEEQEEVVNDSEEQEEDVVDEQEDQEDKVEMDPFGITSSSKSDKEKAIDFEVSEDMTKFITSKYGVNDAETFFTSVDKWRNQSQEGAKVRTDYEDILEGLQELPKDIKAAISAHTNAEDYREAFNSTASRLDYDAPFKSQDKEVIVQHYFADAHSKIAKKLDEGDIDEIDFDERIEELYSASKRSYEADQKMIKDRRADMIADQEKRQEAYRDSTNSSVDLLKEKYPNFSKSNLQKVRQRLVDGNIEDLFKKDDGSYNENAAEMLALALYGNQVIDSLTKQARNKGASKAREDLVSRSSSKPRVSKTQRTREEKNALDAISHLSSSFNKDPYS